jgi:hypothetical protein
MGVWASLITTIIGAGIKLYGSSQSPDYPSIPRMAKIPIQDAKHQMEQYESRRMQAGIDAWKTRFPLLYQGGKSEIEDIASNQKGMLSSTIKSSISNAGLEQPKEGDQYKLSQDLGLSPITLAQRTSQAVTRQIALNPEWTNKISGGTLATMIANNNQNQNAFSQFLGANSTAQYVAGQQRSMYNTAALTQGLIGATGIGVQAYQNAQNPLNNPLNPTSYKSDVSNPGYYTQPQSAPYQSPSSGQSNYSSNMWNAPAPSSTYGNPWGNPYTNYQPFGFGTGGG